jgi:hypothetical protein
MKPALHLATLLTFFFCACDNSQTGSSTNNDTAEEKIQGGLIPSPLTKFPGPLSSDSGKEKAGVMDFDKTAGIPKQYLLSLDTLALVAKIGGAVRVYNGLDTTANQHYSVLWPVDTNYTDLAGSEIKQLYVYSATNLCPTNCDLSAFGGKDNAKVGTSPTLMARASAEKLISQAKAAKKDTTGGFAVHIKTLEYYQKTTSVKYIRAYHSVNTAASNQRSMVFIGVGASGKHIPSTIQTQTHESMCPKNCDVYSKL